MKIIVITQNERIFIPQVLHILLKYVKVSSIITLSPFIHNSNIIESIRLRVMVYGIRYFIVISCIYAKLKFWSIIPGIFRKKPYSISNICTDKEIYLTSFTSVLSGQFQSFLEKEKPDLVVSISAPQKFSRSVIRTPTKGCINLHGSLLPRHRGLQPSFWTLYNGDEIGGTTVHYVGEELDNGDIIDQRKIVVRPHNTQFDIIRKTKLLGAKLLVLSIKKIHLGLDQRHFNNIDEGNYNSFPTAQDVREFFKRNKRLI